MRRLVLSVMFLLACGENASPAPPPFESGQRLRAVVMSGGSGSDLLAYFHDGELGIDCRFAPDRAGVSRCFPRRHAEIRGYTDSACTQPVYTCPACDVDDPMVSVLGDALCNDRVTIGYVTMPSAPPSFAKFPGGCLATTFEPENDLVPVAMPDEMFVAASILDHPIDGPLGPRYLVTADGARQLDRPFVTADHRSCTLFEEGVGGWTCVPGLVARHQPFTDHGFFGQDCRTAIGVTQQQDGCEATTHAIAIDRVVPTAELLPAGFDLGCRRTDAGLLQFWELAEPLDFDLRMTSIPVGDGDARPQYVKKSGQTTLLGPTGEWIDRTRGRCTPRHVDGLLRCVPSPSVDLSVVRRYFTNDLCVAPLVLNDDHLAYAVNYVGGTAAFERAEVTELFALSEESYIGSVFEIGPTGCALANNFLGHRSRMVPIELDSLPTLTLE